MGEETDSTLDTWLDNVATAASELRSRSGARRLVAVGLRLGGTLAALATTRKSVKLRHLIAWDPIIDGKAYLRELAHLHREYMRDEMGSAGWTDHLHLDADGIPDEALGSVITPALAAELGKVHLSPEEIRADNVTVVTTGPAPGLEELKERLAASPTARCFATTTSVPWSSDSAMNAAVVPMDVLQTLIARIEEVSP